MHDIAYAKEQWEEQRNLYKWDLEEIAYRQEMHEVYLIRHENQLNLLDPIDVVPTGRGLVHCWSRSSWQDCIRQETDCPYVYCAVEALRYAQDVKHREMKYREACRIELEPFANHDTFSLWQGSVRSSVVS